MLTFEQIKELIEQVADRRLQGLEIERSGFRLKIEGQSSASSAPAAGSAPAGSATDAPAGRDATPSVAATAAGGGAPAPSHAPVEPKSETSEAGPPPGSQVLKSPIVGTFYRRPSPDADPFVQVGSRVQAGQVLCIVEAMKLMNEIESDMDGEVAEIYPENGQPVEYGEPLFAIKPD